MLIFGATLWRLQMGKIRYFLVGLVAALATFTVTQAQYTDDTCATVVETALEVVEQSCDDLGRNEACYGNNRVDVTFWEEQSEAVFSSPSDRIGVIDLQSIATSPLNIDPEAWGVAVLNLQTNLPNSLPGQAVTFLLMGDTTIENEVSPDDIVAPTEPIPAIVNSDGDIRSQPSTNANIVTTAVIGDEVMLVGVNDAGDWYEIEQESGTAWIWGESLDVEDDISSLTITYGEGITPNYAPMQAFYFQSGVGDIRCNEAPNTLIIQNPAGVPVQMRVNDLNVTIGSTVVFSNHEYEGQRVLLLTLLEGTLETDVNGQPVVLEQLDYSRSAQFGMLAVSVNEAGRVDNNSQIVEIDPEDLHIVVLAACQNGTSMLGLAGLGCDLEQVETMSPRVSVYVPDVAAVPDTDDFQVITTDMPDGPVGDADGYEILSTNCRTTLTAPTGLNFVAWASVGMSDGQDADVLVNDISWDISINGQAVTTALGDNFVSNGHVVRQYYLGPLEPGTYAFESTVHFPTYSVTENCTYIIGE